MTTDQPITSSSTDDDDDKVFAERMAYWDRLDHTDWFENKVGRIAQVVGGGTLDAAADAFSQDHLAETAVETAGSLAVGFAIRAAEARLPILRPALAIGGAALTFSFVRDLLGKSSEVGDIIKDTWNHTDHNEQNRAAFARDGGKFIFDMALSSTAALGGSALGNRVLFGPSSTYTRIATYDGLALTKSATTHNRLYSNDDPVAKLFENANQSTLSIRGRLLKGPGAGATNANGFVISEDGLALTNRHVVEGKDSLFAIDHSGVQHKFTVLATDRPNDMALVQLHKDSPDTVFKPIKFADADAKPGDPVFMLSRWKDRSYTTLEPGQVRDFHSLQLSRVSPPENLNRKVVFARVDPFTRELIPPRGPDNPRQEDARRMLSSYFSKPGFSGSPVLNESGELVALHSGNLGPWLSRLTGRNTSVPISGVSKVLDAFMANRGQ